MTDRLGVAVIGAGGFSGGRHVRASLLAGGELVAVADSQPERSAATALQMGAKRYLSSPRELDADDIDVVHVCTPTRYHEPYVRAALAAGKHVICEKPLASDTATADELTELGQAAGVITAVPFVYRFHPLVREARNRIATGASGELRLIHGSYLQDWLSRPTDWSWRVDPDLGGPSRAFADIGSHWFDLIQFVTGHSITRLMAQFSIAFKERTASHRRTFEQKSSGSSTAVRTEDSATVMFETDRGTHGAAIISQVAPGRKNRLWFEIDAEHEALVFDQEVPDRLWLGGRDQSIDLARDSAVLSPAAARLSILPPGHPQGWNDCLALFVEDVYRQIRGDVAEGLPTFKDGARSAHLVAAALESSKKQQWVEVT